MTMSSLFNSVSKSQFRISSSAEISEIFLSYFDSCDYPKQLTQFQGSRLNTSRKGGVGKTSCAASLAVKFVNHGHPTIVISTDPAHSLSDSFDQDLTGGGLVRVQGMESPLYALQVNPVRMREEFQSASQHGEGIVKRFMDSMGLRVLPEQLGELKLGEPLDAPPPGFDQAFAIANVMQFVESPEYCRFSRIVFDMAPTGHTLRWLSLPDFFDASVGKMTRLKKKITSATAALKSVLGKGEPQQDATDELEQLRERIAEVRDLFRNSETRVCDCDDSNCYDTPSRLCASLLKEKVPVRRLVVNQLLPQSASDCKFCAMKTRDQNPVLDMIPKDPELTKLALIQSHLMDVDIRGIPALKFMGNMVRR